MFATDRLAPSPQSQRVGGVGSNVPVPYSLPLLPSLFYWYDLGRDSGARSSYIMAEPDSLWGVIHESFDALARLKGE